MDSDSWEVVRTTEDTLQRCNTVSLLGKVIAIIHVCCGDRMREREKWRESERETGGDRERSGENQRERVVEREKVIQSVDSG